MSEQAKRRTFTGLLLVLSVTVVGAGVAWACTPQAYVGGANPAAGPSGTATTVTGTRFVPAEQGGTVEIRWDTTTGPVLASIAAPGGNFSTAITIPTASIGNHSVYAIGLNSDGSIAGTGSTGFRVTPVPTGGASAEAGGGSGRAPGGDGSTSASTQGDANKGSGSSQGSGSGSGAGSGGGATVNDPASGDVSNGVVATGGSSSTVAATPSGSGAAANQVFSGSVAPGATPDSSERSALGDLWAGFSGDASLGSATGDSGITAEGRSGPQFAIGLGLLGLGLVALTVGLAVAAGRRRRAEV